MATDDSMSDDVFEDPETQAKREERSKHNDYNDYYFQPTSRALRVKEQEKEHRTPSPSGYPGYKPPKEALQMYAVDSDNYYGDGEAEDSSVVPQYNQDEVDDGWKSYRIDDDDDVYDGIVHKVSICEIWCKLMLLGFTLQIFGPYRITKQNKI